MSQVKKNQLDKNFLKIGKTKIFLGEKCRVNLNIGSMYDYTNLNIPVEVIRGDKPGPNMFICAAIHGDEINGVEIIKRLLKYLANKKIKGTLIVVPVVNVFGFNSKTRYLPDRRDLNRCFPGSLQGSLARRIAKIFMKEVVEKCSYGIDLHTGALHRSNLPQIRACLDYPETKELAASFGAPVIIDSHLRDGSLREAARKKNIAMLLFEGGQALRFEEEVIHIGVKGCISVMKKIGMLKSKRLSKPKTHNVRHTYIAKDSYWIRASHSGSFRALKKLGEIVDKNEVLAVVSDPFGENSHEIVAEELGIIIGASNIPLVNRGDAMFHIATFKNANKVGRAIDRMDEVFI